MAECWGGLVGGGLGILIGRKGMCCVRVMSMVEVRVSASKLSGAAYMHGLGKAREGMVASIHR